MDVFIKQSRCDRVFHVLQHHNSLEAFSNVQRTHKYIHIIYFILYILYFYIIQWNVSRLFVSLAHVWRFQVHLLVLTRSMPLTLAVLCVRISVIYNEGLVNYQCFEEQCYGSTLIDVFFFFLFLDNMQIWCLSVSFLVNFWNKLTHSTKFFEFAKTLYTNIKYLHHTNIIALD